jgi:hypothetical protein
MALPTDRTGAAASLGARCWALTRRLADASTKTAHTSSRGQPHRIKARAHAGDRPVLRSPSDLAVRGNQISQRASVSTL